MSLQAVADELEIALDTVVQWLKRGLPGRKRGGRWWFDMDQVRAWVDTHRRAPPGDSRRADADLRKAEALASIRELELGKRRGEMIDRAAVVEAVGTMAYTLRRRLQSLPAHVAIACAGKPAEEIERILARELDSLLEIVAAAPYADAAAMLCERCATAEGVAVRARAAA